MCSVPPDYIARRQVHSKLVHGLRNWVRRDSTMLTSTRTFPVSGPPPGVNQGVPDIKGAEASATSSCVSGTSYPKSRVGVAVEKNGRWRRTMEDAHSHIHDFGNIPGQEYFAVFDGHAGKFAAEWCAEHVSDILAEELAAHPTMDVREVLKNVFLKADKQLEVESTKAGVRSGCTAVVSLVRPEPDGSGVPGRTKRVLYTANVGDARSVLWYVLSCLDAYNTVAVGKLYA